MLKSIVRLYAYGYDMKPVRFSINEEEYKNAITKLGDKSGLYSFAKDAFLRRLEEVKKKEVWFECLRCKKTYNVMVKAHIEAKTGRLVPVCDCGSNLIRRVKIVDVKD